MYLASYWRFSFAAIGHWFGPTRLSRVQAKLIETWTIDEAGRLLLTAKIESMTLRTPDQKAVFDKK